MTPQREQGQRTPEPDAINEAVRKDLERARKRQEKQYKEAIEARSRPSRSEEKMTIDIIDAMATLSQLLKGRDLTPEKVLDALEDLADNADVFQVMRALMVNGRRSIKL